MKKTRKNSKNEPNRKWRLISINRITLYALICAGIVTILILAFNFESVKQTFNMKAPRSRVYEDNILDNAEKLKKDAVSLTGDYGISNEGITLKPGQEFSVTYRFEKKSDEEVFLQLWFFTAPGVSNKLEVVRPDGQSSVAQNTNLQGSPPLNLTETLEGFTSFDLRLSASLSPSAQPRSVLVYDSIKVTFNSRTTIPPLPSLGYILVFAVGLFMAAYFHPLLNAYSLIISISITFLQLIFFASIGESYVSMKVLSLIAVGLAIGSYIRSSEKFTIRPLIHLLVLWIVMFALDLRWEELNPVINQPLDPDAGTYMGIARGMSGPFDTDFREPFFMWCVKIFFFLFGSTEVNLRLLSLFASLITIVMTYLFATKTLKSPIVGLIAAFILAQSAGYIYQNLRGLRLEIYLLTIIPFVHLLLNREKKADWKYAVILGVLAGLNILNNLSALSFCVLLILYFGIRRKWKAWLIPIPIVLSLLIALPHLLHNKKNFGDPFYSSNVHARYYRNQEFKGKPGFPTVEEVRKNGYTGSHITSFEYFFKLHSFPEVVKRSFIGLTRTYFGKFYTQNIFTSEVFFYCYIVGIILMLFRSPDFLMSFLLLSSTSLFMVGTFPFFDPRLTMHIIFMSITLAAAGLVGGISFLLQHVKTIERE